MVIVRRMGARGRGLSEVIWGRALNLQSRRPTTSKRRLSPQRPTGGTRSPSTAPRTTSRGAAPRGHLRLRAGCRWHEPSSGRRRAGPQGVRSGSRAARLHASGGGDGDPAVQCREQELLIRTSMSKRGGGLQRLCLAGQSARQAHRRRASRRTPHLHRLMSDIKGGGSEGCHHGRASHDAEAPVGKLVDDVLVLAGLFVTAD
jgi:hypothetical protein